MRPDYNEAISTVFETLHPKDGTKVLCAAEYNIRIYICDYDRRDKLNRLFKTGKVLVGLEESETLEEVGSWVRKGEQIEVDIPATDLQIIVNCKRYRALAETAAEAEYLSQRMKFGSKVSY